MILLIKLIKEKIQLRLKALTSESWQIQTQLDASQLTLNYKKQEHVVELASRILSLSYFPVFLNRQRLFYPHS